MRKPLVFVALPPRLYGLFFSPEVEGCLRSFADVMRNETDRDLSEEEMSDKVREVNGAIFGWEGGGLTKRNIAQAKRLKIIGQVGGTVKHIDTETALARGIVIVNSAPAMSTSVAEFALALILDCLHDITFYDRLMRARQEGGALPLGRELTGKRVGLIGFGLIGQKLATLLESFDVEILVYDPYVSEDVIVNLGANSAFLEEVLTTCDVVSVHAGLTPETYHLLDRQRLDLLRPGAILVNTARGDIIDQESLVEKLKGGKLKAALDVSSEEPLPGSHELRGLDNVILTPHRAAHTEEAYGLLGRIVVEDFARFFSGQTPLHVLTKERLLRMT
ncbi:MAG TPA: 3-phosphoglycerate dehydrogenase [Chloroflexi bacterium]|nr:3-phosphoglycerate dehydrogenase [Chloroflexota bacterium]